jgi:hypothetical protein
VDSKVDREDREDGVDNKGGKVPNKGGRVPKEAGAMREKDTMDNMENQDKEVREDGAMKDKEVKEAREVGEVKAVSKEEVKVVGEVKAASKEVKEAGEAKVVSKEARVGSTKAKVSIREVRDLTKEAKIILKWVILPNLSTLTPAAPTRSFQLETPHFPLTPATTPMPRTN